MFKSLNTYNFTDKKFTTKLFYLCYNHGTVKYHNKYLLWKWFQVTDTLSTLDPANYHDSEVPEEAKTLAHVTEQNFSTLFLLEMARGKSTLLSVIAFSWQIVYENFIIIFNRCFTCSIYNIFPYAVR